MRMRIKAMEAHLRARGHTVERAYLFEDQESHDEAGWVVRVDGNQVARGRFNRGARGTRSGGGWRAGATSSLAPPSEVGSERTRPRSPTAGTAP